MSRGSQQYIGLLKKESNIIETQRIETAIGIAQAIFCERKVLYF